MSVENFCQTHPADYSLKKMMQRKRDQGGLLKSLVAILAEDLALAGRDGLRELTRRLNPSSTALAPDFSLSQDFSPTDQQAISDNLAAIMLGNTIISIEEMLRENVLDVKSWCDRYNLEISGTLIQKAVIEGSETVQITDSQWHTMLSFAKEDKSLSIFFGVGFNSLPDYLKLFLSQPARAQAIGKIIPLYKERAKYLIPTE